MKIDLHTHILPRDWPNLRDRYGYGGFVQLEHQGPGCCRMHIDGNHFRTIEDTCWDPRRRIEHGFNCRPDLCAVDNPRNPREYLGKFYLDSLVHDADALRQLLRLVGAERVALGTDYPFPLGEAEPGRLIESLGELSDAVRRRLLAGTALEFLGLDEGFFRV